MSAQDIRLRLAIRRHGIPEVKLIWPCPRSPDMTVAKLLTSVNEVVPLESADWGLEDYAVELSDGHGGSYECLHFQHAPQILKDEDQVIIRSLSTDDLRRRRLSGRHQISTNGRHLVDGVPFGRPKLRVPHDRPALELPPRKRARITSPDMQVADLENELLMLEAPPEITTDDDGDDEWTEQNQGLGSGHSSHDPDADGTSGSGSNRAEGEEEYFDCNSDDLSSELKALADDTKKFIGNQSNSRERPSGHVVALLTAFPLLGISTIEKELLRRDWDLRDTYDALGARTDPMICYSDMLEQMIMGKLGLSDSSPLQPQAMDMLNQRLSSKKPLIEEISSDAGSDSSSEGSTSSEDTSSEDDSTSEDNSDGSESSFEGGKPAFSNEGSDDSSEYRSDDSGNGSSHESHDGSPDERFDGNSAERSDDNSFYERCDSSKETSNDTVRGSCEEMEPASVQDTSKFTESKVEVVPHQGLTKTQKRNARRRRQKAMKTQSAHIPSTKHAELESRKDALLQALLEETPSSLVDDDAARNGDAAANAPAKDQKEVLPVSGDSSVQRRARVDMEAGRRLLFGALGLKNPRTKADEERIRQGLLKNVKPLKNARIAEINAVDNDAEEASEKADQDGDPDAWRSKVTYSAVECCQDGIVLTEPPFPFVQRWDPQQKFGAMRERKRKFEEYYDEESSTDSANNAVKPVMQDPFRGSEAETAEEAGETGAAVEKAQANGGQGCGEDKTDLPQLPADLESLVVLEKGTAKEGMVITWKQCIMSKATGWQPVIKSITGKVLRGTSESRLEVLVALRDRDGMTKKYDEKTGQRIYDKFETPDFGDEDEDDVDEGHRIVEWTEVMEPRIVAATSPWP